MKHTSITLALLVGFLISPAASALTMQRNVRAGANAIDGTSVITRYSSNRLPSWYRLGVEQQGYNDRTVEEHSYTTMSQYRGEIDVDPTVTAPDSDGSHRLMRFQSRASRLRNSWANLFE